MRATVCEVLSNKKYIGNNVYNRRSFKLKKTRVVIVGNIKSIGLKKPVTVTPRDDLDDGKRYLLICGEGRLKAFKSVGESAGPAL